MDGAPVAESRKFREQEVSNLETALARAVRQPSFPITVSREAASQPPTVCRARAMFSCDIAEVVFI